MQEVCIMCMQSFVSLFVRGGQGCKHAHVNTYNRKPKVSCNASVGLTQAHPNNCI